MSLNIYSLISIVPLILSYPVIKFDKLNTLIFLFIISCIIFFIGLRDFVGPDWYVSISVQESLSFDSLKSIILHREPIDLILKIVSSYLGYGMYGVNFIYIFFSILIFILTFNKIEYKKLNLLILFSLPFLILFLHINSPRQAMSIFLLIPVIFLNISIFYKIFIFLMSFLIHSSAIIFLPFLIINILYKNRLFLINFTKKNYTIFTIIYFLLSIILILTFLIFFKIIFPYVQTSFLNNSIASPAYYFRTIYFFPFILLGIYFIFKDEFKFSDKLIILYFIFIYFVTFIISYISTTISDRLNFFLFLYTLFIVNLLINSSLLKDLRYFTIIIILYLYNSLFFIMWSIFSDSFKTWVPYKNVLL